MARRRLVAPDADEVARLRVEAAGSARARAAPPVAQVAGEAADAHSRAFADAMARAEAFAKADADGLVARQLPLAAIDARHLSRDRLDSDAEAMAQLKASIRANGLRTAIEVTPLEDAPGRFGLISGWRRLQALEQLFAETGDPTFTTIKAVVQTPPTARAAYVAMVEENEVRADLSFYERGRIAVVAAELGVFEDVAAAVDVLFAAASPAKRSKVRSFARIHDALGEVLQHPTSLGERLGLRLAAVLERISAGDVAAVLAAAGPPVDAAAEQAALSALIDQVENAAAFDDDRARRRGRPRETSRAGAAVVVELRPGIRLERVSRGAGLELRLSGPSLTDDLADAAATALARVLDGTAAPEE